MVQLNTPSIFGAWQRGEDAAFQGKQRQSQLLAFEEERKAREAAMQREATIRQAIASGVDPSSRKGLGQLLQAGLPLEQFQSGLKSIGDIELAKARGAAAQAQGQGALMRGQAAQQNVAINSEKARIYARKAAADMGFKAQELKLAQQKAYQEFGQNQTEQLSNVARNILALPEAERESAWQALTPQLESMGLKGVPATAKEAMPQIVAFAAFGKPDKQGATIESGNFKQFQYEAAQYGQRMNSSSENMRQFENPSVLEKAFQKSGVLGNFAQTPERQLYYQAQREFINAIKRQESGAAVTESEIEDYSQTYFPQPGDNASVIAQKRQARQRAIAGNKAAAGGAWGEVGTAISGMNEGAAQPSAAPAPAGGIKFLGFE